VVLPEEIAAAAATAQQQRGAMEALRPFRNAQPVLWGRALRQLATDERQLSALLHGAALSGEGAGGEEEEERTIRQAAEALGRAQALHEELGELAEVLLLLLVATPTSPAARAPRLRALFCSCSSAFSRSCSQVQLLLRQTASLYLAAAIQAEQRGPPFERTAASRLKLALRW
jgi:hypothetical protein